MVVPEERRNGGVWTGRPCWGDLSSQHNGAAGGGNKLMMSGVNYEEYKPLGDQHLPLQRLEVPFLVTSITRQLGSRHHSTSWVFLSGCRGAELSALHPATP